METDLIKIKNLAKEKEDENWNFRIFLKGCEINNLDKIVHMLFIQISEAIDCTACGNCCRKIQPILKKKDINKLSKSLNTTPDQFINKYADKGQDGDYVFKQIPCPFLKKNRCTQYDSRPLDCASYPHLSKKDFVFRLIAVVNNYSICPIVFNVYESLKDKFKSEFIDFQDDLNEFGHY